MENQSRLRVGIVGCGYQGGILARSIKEGNEWQVTACADPDQDAAGRVAAIAGNAAVYPSVEQMLQHAEVDAVIVSTSHDALYECSLAAIQAGKHVLTEKPMGMDEKEAAQLEEAVGRGNICFMAGYSFRNISAWQKVRELLDAGAVGEIHSIVGNISLGPMSEGWISKPEMGGGPLLYVGSHLIDQILWYLNDDPVEVSANIRYRADTRADEITTFQLRFAKGAVMQGMVSQASIRFINNLDIFGRQGFIGLRGGGFNYTVEVVSKALTAYSQPTTIHFPQVPDLRILMHLPQLAEFAKAIHEHRQPSCTVTDGRHVLKVLDAIIKSDTLFKQIGSKNAIVSSLLRAEAAFINGDYQKANLIYMELQEHYSLLGELYIRSLCLTNLGLLAMEEGNLNQARSYLEHALLVAREGVSNGFISLVLIELSNLFYLQGNLEGFKRNFREGLFLRNFLAESDKSYILMAILGSLYSPEISARFLGVIHNYEREAHVPHTRVEKRYCVRAEAYAREKLGDTAFESAFAEGQKMSLDEGLDLALKMVEEM